MSEFKRYQRKQWTELRPYVHGEQTYGISISLTDLSNGSPKMGDMIARDPKNHLDQWLVNERFFKDNYVQEPLPDDVPSEG